MYLVSAIITTHKREPETVERALKSIVSQSYKNIEIIVVDDSPSDYCLRNEVKLMVEKYIDSNIQYVQHETCQGACVARNTGLELAKGEFIGFLDDDDEWKFDKIEKQVKGFVNDSVALVYCGSEVMDDVNGHVHSRDTKFKDGNVYEELIVSNFIGSTSFPLIRTEALRQIGGFDVLMQSAQDYDVWLRLALEHEINYVEDALVRYHVHGGDQITKDPVKKINGLERLNQKNEDYLKKHRKARYIRQIKIAPFYAQNGQKGRAFKIWAKSAFICPLKVKMNLEYLYKILRAYKSKI